MTKIEKLILDLTKSTFGDPWHGASVMDILQDITYEHAFHKPIPAVHNIIEILLHMTSWVQEVNCRFKGNKAALPKKGDWPIVKLSSENYWQKTKDEFISETNKLIEILKDFPEERLNEYPQKARNKSLGTGFTYEGLIWGIIQHNAYHSGQIGLLKKSFSK